VTKLLKSILKTAVYVLDQADNAADDMRDRVTDQILMSYPEMHPYGQYGQ